jgi:capsular polysaccharide biosynthesis protein
MELRTYLEILWRRKWVIATTAMATLAIVVVGTLMITPSYRALSTIRVAMAASGPISYTDYMYAERLMNTYAELATSRPVLDELANELGDRVPAQIKVEVMPDTELIHIIVEDANPVLASEAANTLAEILVAQSRRLYASGSKTAAEILGEQVTQTEEELKQEQREYEAAVLQSPNDSERIDALGRSIALKQETYNTLLQQYESARATEAIRANALSVVESATTPQAPSKPSKVLNVALGCMVGLMGGVGLAFLFEHLDTRLHTVEQIEEATALPTLGRIPYTRKGPHNIALDGSSPQREAYRRLRTGIYAAGQGAALRTLLVTSAQPGEGKSTIVTNLAAAMAQDGLQLLPVQYDRPYKHPRERITAPRSGAEYQDLWGFVTHEWAIAV